MKRVMPKLDLRTRKYLLKYRTNLSVLPVTERLSELIDCLTIMDLPPKIVPFPIRV